MKLTFYGAARTVTGSKHLLEANGKRILLDCGLFQGRRQDTFEKNRNFLFDPKSIDVVVLSHAHIDHSGNIPNLIKQGFRGDVICTHATRDLCAAMLVDSGHIQERDVVYVNKRLKREGKPLAEAVYTEQDALDSLNNFVSIDYFRSYPLLPGITLRFLDAGHMLGSAVVVIEIEDSHSHKTERLVFSGDIGRQGIPIIRDPQTVDSTDYLIMESTYGNRLHEPYPDAEFHLKEIINQTYERRGKVIIPAFAVGRTQQIVYELHRLSEAGEIPRLPIYVDSPLAVNVTEVFRTHPECYDRETKAFVQDLNGGTPFGFEDLTYIRSVEASKSLNDLEGSAVIISASGMAEFGRVVHHLKNNIEDPRTTVLITGWQAPHTLGRRLVEGAEIVRIFGEEYRTEAHVEVLNGFSGHADHDELIAWVGAISDKPKRTFLVHGEEDAAFNLKNDLETQFNLEVNVPAPLDKFTLS